MPGVAGAGARASSLFNVRGRAARLHGLAYVGWDWVAGLVWFMLKSFMFVFVFVWMRGTFPRVRIDHLMGFAWKWLLPAVAAQPVHHRHGDHRRASSLRPG